MRYIYITYLLGIIYLLSLTNCSGFSNLDYALSEAGENSKELQTVLDHCVGDSLKYAAAVFLIENMPYRYGLEGKELGNLYEYYDAAYKSGLSPRKVTDSIQATGIDLS